MRNSNSTTTLLIVPELWEFYRNRTFFSLGFPESHTVPPHTNGTLTLVQQKAEQLNILTILISHMAAVP